MIESGKPTAVLQWLGIQMAQIGLLCLMFALFFGLSMLFYWHANDAWPNWSALDIGWTPPTVELAPLSKVLLVAYQLPIGAVAACVGLLLTFAGNALTRS